MSGRRLPLKKISNGAVHETVSNSVKGLGCEAQEGNEGASTARRTTARKNPSTSDRKSEVSAIEGSLEFSSFEDEGSEEEPATEEPSRVAKNSDIEESRADELNSF